MKNTIIVEVSSKVFVSIAPAN